ADCQCPARNDSHPVARPLDPHPTHHDNAVSGLLPAPTPRPDGPEDHVVHDATDSPIDRPLAGEFERVLMSYRAGGSTPASVRSYRESASRFIAHLRD